MPSFSTLADRCGGKTLIRLLALLLALAVTAPLLPAQEWDHLNGRDKVHDPTGAWLLRTSLAIPLPTSAKAFFLIVFHHGGTVTEDVQGESAFDPTAVTLPLSDPNSSNNVITIPQSGVWQKTGWNTFAATLLDIEYHVQTSPQPGSPVFQFSTLQYTGRLNVSGDTMELTALNTHYDVNGNQTGSGSFKANGVRIPLKVLPNTFQSLTIPPEPQ